MTFRSKYTPNSFLILALALGASGIAHAQAQPTDTVKQSADVAPNPRALTPEVLRELAGNPNQRYFRSISEMNLAITRELGQASTADRRGAVAKKRLPINRTFDGAAGMTRSMMRAPGMTTNFIGTGSPTVYSNMPSNGVQDLWKFPTLGYDTANQGNFLNVPMTFDGTTAPAGFQTLGVMYGEMGRPTQLDSFTLGGNVRTINQLTGGLTDADGQIFILIFDGVDANNPPNLGDWYTAATPTSYGNIATSTSTFGHAIYSSNFTAANTSNFWTFTFATTRIRITDARGKFGIMVGKVSDPLNNPLTQWIALANCSAGRNSIWPVNGDTGVAASTTVALAADTLFNQSARNNYPNNVYGSTDGGTTFAASVPTYGSLSIANQANGYPLGTTAGKTGGLRFTYRRQGVSVPSLTVAEKAPSHYAVIGYSSDFSSIVRVDQGFTNPTYAPSTTTPGTIGYYYNGIQEGYPIPTANTTQNYQFGWFNLPIIALNAQNNPVSDQVNSLTDYPGNDFIPLFTTTAVAVKDFATATANITSFGFVEVPHVGDITGYVDPNNPTVRHPDGIVDLTDLIELLNNYGSNNATSDLTGPVNATYTTAGPPDGTVDLLDLIYLLNRYGQGNLDLSPYGQ